MLEAQVKELVLQLQRNSSNSSTPPSANPLDAPKLPGKPPSGRKPGGQKGHRGHSRQRLPPERVNRIETYLPTTCSGCQAALPVESGPHDPEPSWHQVAELPPMAAIVTEHQAHARICPGCGQLNCATIPEEVRAHVIGPRLAATLSFLAGRMRLSKRLVAEMAEEVFDVPVSLGTVVRLEQQTSDALVAAYEQAGAAVAEAPVKNVDETGWKQAGARRRLWMAATATVAYFVIHNRRGAVGLEALLGEAISGIIISDRWNGYNALPLEQRQVCWAHLKRDFRKCSERGVEGKVVGDVGLAVVEDLFTLWWEFRDGLIDRSTLQRQLEPAIEELRAALERGTGCADGPVRSFCDNLLVLYPAL